MQIEACKWYLSGTHPKFDLVIDQFHGIPFFAPLYVRVKKLGFIHEVAKEVWKLNPWPKPMFFIPSILGTLIEPLIFRILYRNILFMTVSESTKQDLISWGISKANITVVHNGVSVPDIKIPPKEIKKTLIYLGAISKDKGIEDALEVFSLINKENWQFWVVGKSDFRYLNFLKEKAKLLGIDKQLKFWGYVSEIKKFQLLSRAHILVNPSVREGWGLVVIEAASMGTPTVAFDVQGLRDSILDDKTGVLDKKHSTLSMAEEIADLLYDEKRYQQMRMEAIKWSKDFSWHKASRESLKLIESIAKKEVD